MLGASLIHKNHRIIQHSIYGELCTQSIAPRGQVDPVDNVGLSGQENNSAMQNRAVNRQQAIGYTKTYELLSKSTTFSISTHLFVHLLKL